MNYLGIILGIIVFIVIYFVAWALIKGAPWFPTRMKKVREMLALLDIQPDEVIYDLGCGDGRFIIRAVRKYKAKAIGIEINIFLYLICQFLITILGLRGRAKIRYGNLFKLDLSDANIVICYLLQETNDKLEDKLLKELKPTTRVISNSFLFNNLPVINEDKDEGIFIYRV